MLLLTLLCLTGLVFAAGGRCQPLVARAATALAPLQIQARSVLGSWARVMRRPPGRWVVDRPGEQGLPEDDAGDAGVAQAAEAVEVSNPAGHQDLRIVRPNERPGAGEAVEVRLGTAVGQHEPGDAGPDELADSASTVGGAGRRHGKAASRSGRGSSPTASQSPATATHARRSSGRSAMTVDEDDPGRAGGEGQADRLGRVDAAGELERDRDPGRDRPDGVEVARTPARAPSKSTRWISRAPIATNRSAIRSGRSVGAPTPDPAPGQ